LLLDLTVPMFCILLAYYPPISNSGDKLSDAVVPVADKVPADRLSPEPIIISSITPAPAVDLPINLLVFIRVDIIGVEPPDEVIGLVALTEVTPPPPPVLIYLTLPLASYIIIPVAPDNLPEISFTPYI
jgi:hypothetical protein